MPGIKISDLVVAPVIAGDIVITQRGTSNYGGTIGNQISTIESLIEAFQNDTSTAALSIKVDQNNLHTNSTASILFDNNNGTTVGRILWDEVTSTFNLGYGANNHLTIDSTGAVTIAGDTVWTAGNDGAGSGLDADLLDGQQPLGLLVGRATTLDAGTAYQTAFSTTAANRTTGVEIDFVKSSEGWPSFGTVITAKSRGGGGGSFQLYNGYGSSYGGNNLRYRTADYTANTSNPPWTDFRTIWDSGNDGPTSGLDADLLDGQHGSYYGTATDVAANTAKDLSIYSTSVNSYRTVSTVNGAVSAAGWVTVATNTTGRKHGEVIVSDSDSPNHAFIRIDWMRSYADSNYSVLQVGGHQNRITGVRVLSQDSDNTYGVKLLQVYVTVGSTYGVRINTLGSPRGYVSHSAVTPVIENTKSGYTVHGNALTNLDLVTLAAEEGIKTGGVVYASGGDSTNWNTAYTKTAILDYDATLFNLSLGDGALAAALLTGTNNIASGYHSLFSNTTGSHNIATGYYSLYTNDVGSNNIASGYASLYTNDGGSYNTAIGYASLYANTTGSNNVAIGPWSLRLNTQGSNNVASGFESLYSNTTGNYNIASGYRAGRYQADGTTALTVANDSIFIGKETRGVDSATNQIVIGDTAIGLGSNTVVLGSSATTLTRLHGKLALGKDIASTPLHVYEDNPSSGPANGITIEQDGTGDALLQFLLTGAQRWAVGADNSAADSFVISPSPLDGANGLTIDTSGNVGIGTTTPNASAVLDVSSTTKAFLPPRMTTTQKNAIASPAAGMVVYDTTLSKLAVYTGSAWETITSTSA